MKEPIGATYVDFSHRSFSGSVHADYKESLLSWLQQPSGAIVKENRARRIWSVTNWKEKVFIKEFKAHSLLQRTRLMLLESRAEKEFSILLKLRTLAIPAPLPIAAFIAEEGSYLVTQAIEASPIKDFLQEKHRGHTEVNALLSKLADLVRTIFNNGMYHKDFHIGNILVGRDGAQSLSLIDVHRAEFRKTLSPEVRRRMTSFLILSIAKFLTSSQILRLLKSIVEPSSGRDEIRGILADAELLRREYYRRHLGRCLKTGSGFEVIREGNDVIYLKRGADVALVKAILASHRTGGNVLIKTLPARRISRYLGTHFVKEFRRPAPLVRLSRPLGFDHGRTMWKMCHALRMREIPTPDCLALVEGGRSTYVIGEWITEAQPLNDFFKTAWATSSPADRRVFLHALASILRRMTKSGLFHADLKANNILVNSEGGLPRFYLLDIESVREIALARDASPLLIKNLSQLNGSTTPPLTKTERLRFFYDVIGNDRPLLAHKKGLLREIMRRTIARRHLWPGAPNRG